MTIDERDRMRLFEQLDQTLGPNNAKTLMELLPPVGWADVATKDDVRLCQTTLQSEITGLRAELKGDNATLRAELKGDISELRTELTGAIASMQRNLFLALIGFALTIWISLLIA